MFLRITSIFKNRFTRNAFLFYFASLMLVVGVLLFMIYISLYHSLIGNVKNSVLEKELRIARQIQERGAQSLITTVGEDFFIRVSDASGKTLLENKLKEEGFDHLEVLQSFFSIHEKPVWITVNKTDDEDKLWVWSEWISPGLYLQVGKSDSSVNDQIESLLETYLGAIVPLFIFSFAVAMFLVNKIRHQLQEVISTVQKIKSGDLKERVRIEKSGLQDMIILFNGMLDQIEILVNKNRDELDHFAHDIKTPITRFKLLAEKALMSPTNTQFILDALEESNHAADEIIQMISSLFDISLSESGAKLLQKTTFNLTSVVKEVLEMHEIMSHEKNIVFKSVILAETLVFADRHQIKRVISNVIDNAIKYSPAGLVIHISLEADKHFAKLKIRDHGPGIPADEFALVWNRFFRGKKVIESTTGFGLGLSFVKTMTEANAGKVFLSSDISEGTEIVVCLPLTS